jgi:putative SOS response-associated peptidase YedK
MKANPVEGQHTLFGFLTCEPNDVVGAVHPKAMPVILTSDDEIERWMTAPAEEALKLQRPLRDGTLKVVARGEREDGISAAA